MSRPPLPANWPTLRKLWIGSLIPGSTEAVDVIDHAARVQAGYDAAGERLAQHRKDVSDTLRSALKQAAGLEPVKGGPYPGQLQRLIPVTDPQWPEKALRRIAANPSHYGVEQAPGGTLAREVWMEERRKLPAQSFAGKP